MTKTELITILIRVVFAVVSVILTTVIIPVIKAWYAEHQDDKTLKVIQEAVKALEQEFKGSPGHGKVKKQEVLLYVQKWMENHGIDIDMDTIDKWIEAAVYELNAGK